MGITGKRLAQMAHILHDKVAWGLQTVDEQGNVIKDYPVDKNTRRIIIPAGAINSGGGTGGSDKPSDGGNSSGTDTTPEGRIPNVCVDTDPGRFLINREALWSGRTTPEKVNTITLDRQITGINGIGDGLQFSVLLQKRETKNGVTGDPVDLPIKSSAKNKKISGYFVTTSPVPISIRTKDIVAGKKLEIPFDGIGEDLDGIQVHQAPKLTITYNADGTFTVEDQQGWYLDKTGDGNNGATYHALITHINSFTICSKVEALPNATVLWKGNAFEGPMDQPSQIALKYVNKDYSNAGSGIRVYFPDQLPILQNYGDNDLSKAPQTGIVPFENLKLNIPNPVVIPFAQLDDGNVSLTITSSLKQNDKIIAYSKGNTGEYDSMFLYQVSNNQRRILLKIDGATLNYQIDGDPKTDSQLKKDQYSYPFIRCYFISGTNYIFLPILKITSYQE